MAKPKPKPARDRRAYLTAPVECKVCKQDVRFTVVTADGVVCEACYNTPTRGNK